MKLLAVNPGHNGSVCLVEDGQIIFYVEEERVSRMKYDANPFRASLIALQDHIDILVLGGTCMGSYPNLTWTGESLFHAFVRKFNKNIKIIDMTNYHHLGHAATAFYNSGFDQAACVIVDGCGSMKGARVGTTHHNGFEVETIYKMSYPGEADVVYQSIADASGPVHSDTPTIKAGPAVPITKAYEAVTHFLGWHFIEAGKTMGLAPYGKHDPAMPRLFDPKTNRGDFEVLYPQYPGGALVRTDTHKGKYFVGGNPASTEWHKDQTKVTQIAKDLAWHVQEETQRMVGDLIEKAADEGKTKNICISGGYGLNCMANYYYQKRFPKLNIFSDPVAHDGGTAIGLAKLVWYRESENTTKYPLKTLYLGPKESAQDYSALDGLDKTKYKTSEVSDAHVARMLKDQKVIAYFQGRSEAGPRALGNRSILYTPLDPHGKDHVNTVKGREWFRPFAGSMLQEHFEEWFETHGLTESPYMMYAMDFKQDKRNLVPAITHVDGTCRIQTVTKEQNPRFYNLIWEFYQQTDVPIIFNTSFNLAGEPLVETVTNALEALEKSKIEYLYMPQINTLIEKI